jgi:hypothetical protein
MGFAVKQALMAAVYINTGTNKQHKAVLVY